MKEIITTLIPVMGTIAGSFLGVVASQKLTNHRLEQLEKKVNKHNGVMERTYRLEEQVKVANHRIADLEENEKKRG